jgi:uncharacterized protein
MSSHYLREAWRLILKKYYLLHLRFFVILFVAFSAVPLWSQNSASPFRVLAIAEPGGIHKPFVDVAKIWLMQEGNADNFTVDYIEDTKSIDAAFLSHYRLFIQLNYPPYNWTPTAAESFTKAIEQGTIGWIGFHHAALLGEFDGYQMWPWFSQFMGDIRFAKYIPTFATATVNVEAPGHPAMKGLPKSFTIENEEWYTWSKSPRANVHVLASVDEKTYSPDSPVKMGDHPVVWSNEHIKARNIYIFMGHHPELFQNTAFTTLFHNSILWAAGK